jgi:hypothetical protein
MQSSLLTVEQKFSDRTFQKEKNNVFFGMDMNEFLFCGECAAILQCKRKRTATLNEHD